MNHVLESLRAKRHLLLPAVFVVLSILLWTMAQAKVPMFPQLVVLALLLAAWPVSNLAGSIWRGASDSLRIRRSPAAIIPWQYRVPAKVAATESELLRGPLKRHLKFVADDDRKRVTSAWLRALNRNEPVDVEYRRVLSDGRSTWVLDVGQVLDDEGGRPRVLAGISVDITRRKEAERILWAAKEQAETANRTKSEFLAHMSHEIRNPLSAILGFCEVLSDQEVSDPDRLEAVNVIKRNGELLFRIVNNILDLSKIEAGRLEIEHLDFDLKELVEDVAANFDRCARQKGLDFSCDFVEPLPRRITSDPMRLKQILINIIGNALKYTASGSISLAVRATPLDAEGRLNRISITVSDTGIGFSSEQRDRVFKNYAQAEHATARKYGGTGLGLVLSRKLATMLGGSVELIDSRADQGSTFLVVIEAKTALAL